MPLIASDVVGSPYIGLYCVCTEKIGVFPIGVTSKKMKRFAEALGVEVCSTDIGRCRLLGVLAAGNSNGIVLPHSAEQNEIQAIRSHSDANVQVISEKRNALGNMILVNDNGAIVDPRLPRKTIEAVSDVLGVEVVTGEILGLPCIGAFAATTNKGVLVHPLIREDEKRKIQEVLKVPVEVGTVNGGIPYMKVGLVANSKGAVVGSSTTGPELMAITRTLGIW
ncbi:translation initiation factor IF-6 [Candidatus Bathyarchaeota archaeon]|nr:translation initiation factor IF-6 [Candidatus Bathyarchaeota archaeon]